MSILSNDNYKISKRCYILTNRLKKWQIQLGMWCHKKNEWKYFYDYVCLFITQKAYSIFVFFWFSVFFISFEAYFLTMNYSEFRNVLFSFQLFGDFPVISLLLISSLIPLWAENTYYDFIPFTFVEIFLITQKMVYLGNGL